ncbi:MAG: AAA family ATPase [Myxococcales bacterium]|jgi:anion-transporting  ArsA/GET3 family ATPase|nr:AAA family ATPase [Myxococcales bacterium]
MSLERLLADRRIVVCCGAGGVGKTTISAALGLAAARLGRRTLVLTIDPARRLAQAMGLPENARAPVPVRADRLAALSIAPGNLHAWMLLPEVIFEQMILELTDSPEQARRIQDNRIYQLLSRMTAGMQEYTAAEAVHRLSVSGNYDLVVLDTPPSRNALDFLVAPGRIAGFLDERVVSIFLPKGERRQGVLARKARGLIDAVFARIFGASFHAELFDFIDAFSGMFGAMRDHANCVKRRLESDAAAFLVVTAQGSTVTSEALFLRKSICRMGFPFRGFILNRSLAGPQARQSPEAMPIPADCLASGLRTEDLIALAEVERWQALRDREHLNRLRREAGKGAFAIAAPHLGTSIEDLCGLALLAQGLLEAEALVEAEADA